MLVRPTTHDDLRVMADADPEHYPDQAWRAILLEKPAEHLAQYAHTVVNRHRTPIAVIGVSPMWLHVGEIWWVWSKDAYQYRYSMSRLARSLIPYAAKLIDAVRLQATVPIDNQRQVGFLVELGFRIEGTLRSYYGKGKHYVMLSMTWED